jgi:SAM-dependent methyltransferase
MPPATATTLERHAYERWHDSLGVDAEIDTPWHRQIVAQLGRNDYRIEGRVLEIGCGRGGFACWLASHPGVSAVVAADFSGVAVTKGWHHAAQQHVDTVRWAVADIQRIPFAPASFDNVVSCETIEHLPSPRSAIAELFRVVRPGGRLYLTCPNYMGPIGLYRGYMRLRGQVFTEEGQPINRFLLLPLTLRWLRVAGFRVESFDSAGHYLPWPGAPPRDMGVLRPSWLARWFGLHACVVATKPR